MPAGPSGLQIGLLRAVQWTQTELAVQAKEQGMNRIGIHPTVRSSLRTRWPSLSPYYMDDTAFTLAEIVRDRSLDTSADK